MDGKGTYIWEPNTIESEDYTMHAEKVPSLLPEKVFIYCMGVCLSAYAVFFQAIEYLRVCTKTHFNCFPF